MPRTKQRNQPVTPDRELRDDLRAAQTPTAIVRAVARVEYRRTHPDRDCPAAEIPGVEELMEWSRKTAARFAVSAARVTDDRRSIEKYLVDKHQEWCASSRDTAEHPLARLVPDWQAEVRSDPRRRHLISPAELTERGEMGAVPLVRAPGLLSLASFSPIVECEVEAVEVAGESFACVAHPSTLLKRVYRRVREPRQTELCPGPRSLARELVGEVVLHTLATNKLIGDERNPIRGDVFRVALFTFAASGPIALTPSQGARFVGGADTSANRRRWWVAIKALRGMTIRVDPRTGEFRDLAVISIGGDGTTYLGPPVWWRGKHSWRLTGRLFCPAVSESKGSRQGTSAGYWGGLNRLIAGIEAALAWSPTAGRGRDGRIPDNLRPAFGDAGPGPMVFIPWWKVLELSGEHLPDNPDPKSAAGRRFNRRVCALEEAGYRWPPAAGEASAGDTIEIQRAFGGRGRRAGLYVRASARMVEAVKRSQDPNKWTGIPASRLLGDDELPVHQTR